MGNTAKKKPTRKPLRTARLDLVIEPKLKRAIHAYARRHHKSVSSIITEHFYNLLAKEKEPNVEQI